MNASDIAEALTSAREYIADLNADISSRTYRHGEQKYPTAWDYVDQRQFNGDTASMLAMLDSAIADHQASTSGDARFGRLLEPAALVLRPDDDGRVRASLAISMKRIADALRGDGQNIFTAPINSYGEGIGDAIQGQMVRGQRGIDQYEGR